MEALEGLRKAFVRLELGVFVMADSCQRNISKGGSRKEI
jgi:hypothetical protein